MTESLFTRRTPDAAARQLAIVLKSATEMHLATLERLRERKSSAKYDLKRQQEICDTLIQQCIELGVPADMRGLRGVPCPRLDEYLRSNATAPRRPL